MFNINQFYVIINQSSEFLLSILMCLIILLFFIFPLNKYSLNKITHSEKFSNSDAFCINIVFHSLLFLVFSFYNINKELFISTILILSVCLNLILIKKIFTKSEILLTVVFLIFFITYCVKIASFASLEWDGLASWFYKTQIFFQNGNVYDLNKVPYSFYPHLGPFIWSFFWKISQSEYEYLGRFFYVFVFIISCLNLSSRVKNKEAGIILFICMVIFLTEFTLFGGYQEYFIFSLITIFSSFFFFYGEEFKNNKIKFSILYLIILSILPWIKDEGLFGSFLLLFLIIFSKKYKLKELVAFIIFFLFLLICNYFLEQNIKGNIGWQFEFELKNINNLLNLNIAFTLFFNLLFEVIKCFIRYPIWIGILLSVIILNIYKKQNEMEYTNLISLTFLIQLIVFFIGYLFLIKAFPAIDGILHLQTSTFRLILQTSGLYCVLIIELINYYEKDKNLK